MITRLEPHQVMDAQNGFRQPSKIVPYSEGVVGVYGKALNDGEAGAMLTLRPAPYEVFGALTVELTQAQAQEIAKALLNAVGAEAVDG